MSTNFLPAKVACSNYGAVPPSLAGIPPVRLTHPRVTLHFERSPASLLLTELIVHAFAETHGDPPQQAPLIAQVLQKCVIIRTLGHMTTIEDGDQRLLAQGRSEAQAGDDGSAVRSHLTTRPLQGSEQVVYNRGLLNLCEGTNETKRLQGAMRIHY